MNPLSSVEVEFNEKHVTIKGHRFYIPKFTLARELLPRGANGIVFEATDETLQRRVAIKIWVPREEDYRDRNRQALAEARKIAKLNHANIIQIYSCNQFDNGWVYSVMEFLDGTTLRDYLKIERPELVERVRIWHEIEKAIEYAHSLGVYHGDLHDRNVMLVERQVKVIDFGTSTFALKRVDSQLRETRRLLDLSQKIFCEYEPKFSQITDEEISTLKPELALSALSAWISILLAWGDIVRVVVSKQYDNLFRVLWHLASDVTSAPVFSVSKIADKLVQGGMSVELSAVNIPVNSVDLFVGWCVHWAQIRLQQIEEPKNGGIDKYNYDVPLDRQSNETLLKTLWPKIRAGFQLSSQAFH